MTNEIKEFYRPETVQKAVELKKRHGNDAVYFAGGTHLNFLSAELPAKYPSESSARSGAKYYISVERLGFKDINPTGKTLEIGAAVTLQELLDGDAVPESLKQAAALVFPRPVRNMATIGGNIGAKRLDSYLIPCLIALSAEVETAGEGTLLVEDYVLGEKDFLITRVILPDPNRTCEVRKVSSSANALPVLSVALSLRNGGEDSGKRTILVLGGVGDRLFRLPEVEEGIEKGKYSTREELEKAVSSRINPKGDFLGSAEYRKYIAGVTAADCLEACCPDYFQSEGGAR